MAEIFAITAPGLEVVAAAELAAFGVEGRVIAGGVEWSGTSDDVYRACLHLRTASRVVVRAARFRARSFIELERHLKRTDWSSYLPPEVPLSLRVSSGKSRLYHERAIAERFTRQLTSAGYRVVGGRTPDDDSADFASTQADSTAGPNVADDGGAGGPRGGHRSAGRGSQRDRNPGTGPVSSNSEARRSPGSEEIGGGPALQIDSGEGAQLVIIRFHRDECVVSVDAAGELLHRRGYRQAVARAPLRETIAAAMLLSCGWRAEAPLLDPFCGSGTIPIEAALISRDIAPGLAMADRSPRGYAFELWPNFDQTAWERIVREAQARIRDVPESRIGGSDRDEGAIEAAVANAARAGLADDLHFLVAAVSEMDCAGDAGWIVTNPPYGIRVGESGPLRNLYAALGRTVQARCDGWSTAMLSADPRLASATGFDWREVLRTSNGGVPVTLLVGRP